MKRTAILIFGLLLALTGCQRRSRIVSLPPVPPPPAAPAPPPEPVVVEPIPAPLPVEVPAPRSAGMIMLDAADRAFSQGDYVQAAKSYESFLHHMRDGEGGRDAALFNLGLIYAAPEAPNRDWNRATEYLKELIEEHPDSDLRPSASLVISLYSEVNQLRTDGQKSEQRIKQLSSELEKLKKIDAARKKP